MLFKTFPTVLQNSFRVLSTTATMARQIKTALVQMSVGKDRLENLEKANKLIINAKRTGADLIILPECFNSPYGTNFFSEYAEIINMGPTSTMLSKAAKDNKVYLIAGTFPEIVKDKLYNTCTVWDPEGKLVAQYRKMHLFDIDIKDGITFKESDVLAAGKELATFTIGDVKIGLGICYDLRFEELSKLYRKQGCEVIVFPGAFNMTTGPIHWELLQRGRALDNQLYVFGVSPARGRHGYIAWGHSQVTDPWGKVVAKAGYDQEILRCVIDLEECTKVRQQIPIFPQRRTDIYDTILKVDTDCKK